MAREQLLDVILDLTCLYSWGSQPRFTLDHRVIKARLAMHHTLQHFCQTSLKASSMKMYLGILIKVRVMFLFDVEILSLSFYSPDVVRVRMPGN